MNFLTNYVLNFARIHFKSEPIYPLIYSWYATHRCTLQCVYCSDGNGEPFKNDICEELPLSEVKKMLDILRKDGDTFDITGGEPLERSDLEEILAYAKQIGFHTIINTKGIGIENRPDILKYSDVIALSIDSLSTSTLAAIIGAKEDTARRILSAFEFLLHQRYTSRFDLTLSVVIMADTIHNVFNVIDIAEKEKLAIALSPRLYGTEVHYDVKNHPEYRTVIDTIIQKKSQGMRILGINEYWKGIRDLSPYRCYPSLMPNIRPDGALYYPCLELRKAPVNLLNESSYPSALRKAAGNTHSYPFCSTSCHIMCHMGLSKLQIHPLSALRELLIWRK